jgi:hypothetical protein
MSVKILLRAMFVFWAMSVAALSVISYPGSKDLLMSVKLTSSGFVVHCIAYFVGVLLCYFSFTKKKDRGHPGEISYAVTSSISLGKEVRERQRLEIRSQISEDEKTEDEGRRLLLFGFQVC